MKLLYLLKWSFLRDLSTAWLSRALFVISLAPFIARLIRLLDLIRVDPILLQVAFFGAILFALTSLMIKLLAPPPILNERNSHAYQSYLTTNASAVDFSTLFREFPKLLEDISKFCPHVDGDKLKELMPPEAVPRSMGRGKAAFLLSHAYYELLDLSRPWVRNILAALSITAVLMMLCSVIRWSVTIMGEMIQWQ